MPNHKKTKTQQSPTHQLRPYKSTQFKSPYQVHLHTNISHSRIKQKDKSLTKQQSHSRSLWIKNTQRDDKPQPQYQRTKPQYQINKHKFIQPSLQASSCKLSPTHIIPKKMKGITQKTYAQSPCSQHINKSYKIEDLLGINSNNDSKKSSIIVTISHKPNNTHNKQTIANELHTIHSNHNYSNNTNNTYTNNISHNKSINSSYGNSNIEKYNEVQKLKQQNKQLMRNNQMLLYQKQYYKQKMILQQVQIRQLQKKLNDLVYQNNDVQSKNINVYGQNKQNHQIIQLQSIKNSNINNSKKGGHNKNKSEQSDLTFKIKQQNDKIYDKENGKQNGNVFKTAKKENKLINLAIVSNKSSLLVSQSQEERMPLKNKQNVTLQASVAGSILQRTQKQFSELLQSVQNESNMNRKTTLRKMLALKAMELKKVKQNY